MLKRKIETVLQDWKKNPSRKPLVIKGVRQCGKTFSVQRFAEENYAYNVYIDFYEMEEAKAAFRGSKKVDDIVMYLTAMIPGATFVPGETCLILDELQHPHLPSPAERADNIAQGGGGFAFAVAGDGQQQPMPPGTFDRSFHGRVSFPEAYSA